MNIFPNRKLAIISVIATSLLSIVNPVSATSGPTLVIDSVMPQQLVGFKIPNLQPEASVNNEVLQVAISASFLKSPIDSIVSANEGGYKDTDDRRQLLVKQRHRDHEMFIVRTGDCGFIGYNRIWSLDPHSARLNRHIRCSLG